MLITDVASDELQSHTFTVGQIPCIWQTITFEDVGFFKIIKHCMVKVCNVLRNGHVLGVTRFPKAAIL